MSGTVMNPPMTLSRHGNTETIVGYVYRCDDENDRPLYVGQSVNTTKRFNTHRCVAPWWSQVAHIHLIEVRDDHTLNEIERAEIAAIRPLHNRLHNPDWEWSYPRKAWVPTGTVSAESRRASMLDREYFRLAVALRQIRKGADIVPIRRAS